MVLFNKKSKIKKRINKNKSLVIVPKIGEWESPLCLNILE
jgi:hypothetical protein